MTPNGTVEFIPIPPTSPLDLVMYRCATCETSVLSVESDAHAARAHHADTLRVFENERAYNEYQEFQKIVQTL